MLTLLFLERVKTIHGLKIFYFQPAKKPKMYKVYKDEKNSYNYIWFEGKKLYLAKSFSQYIKINGEDFVNDIWAEQDENSPHLYEHGDVVVKEGDILVNAGVCEGNFALHNIDKVKKVYLIECDKEWIKALKLTFAPYKEKVVFCNKYLSNKDTKTTVTLDTLIGTEEIDFLKMDIEGEEVSALLGGERVWKNSPKLKCSICAYHRKEHEEKIKDILINKGYKTDISKGYMVFIHDDEFWNYPEIRRGIIRGIKNIIL